MCVPNHLQGLLGHREVDALSEARLPIGDGSGHGYATMSRLGSRFAAFLRGKPLEAGDIALWVKAHICRGVAEVLVVQLRMAVCVQAESVHMLVGPTFKLYRPA